MTIANNKLNSSGLPRLPVDLSAHKLAIALNWTPIILTSGLLPIVGYFALRYGTDLELNIVFSPWLALMGVVSLFALFRRTWALVRKDSDCRPLGAEQSRWAMDFFGWNFLIDFLILTAFISAGIATELVQIVSLPLSILLLITCLELVIAQVAMAAGAPSPIRLSSVARGAPVRTATYTIVEDVVAVDGKQGQQFRQAMSDRYEASAAFRSHLRRMDWMWGISGLAIVAVVWGVVFGVQNKDVGYVVGWALPWVWAGIMTLITIQMSKSMLRREGEMQRGHQTA